MHTLKMFDLSGKIAVVTGGAGDYGRAISLALAEAGAHVIVASRNIQRCKAYAELLVEKGLSAEGAPLNLSQEESIGQFTENILKVHSKIDILVNNAASFEGFKNLEDVTRVEWELAQQTNSTGLMMITKSVVSGMRKRQSGNIINISSIKGTVGPNFPIYEGTDMISPVNYSYDKWGMIGFTKWLANYYGKFNIRANCISPGGHGPSIRKNFGENSFVSNYKRLTPLQRFVEDDDIKGPIVFLASEASSFVTGQNLLVDGGWTNW